MRSRNEASFAQWLDRRHWNWEYEPLCFADETGQYLPDFRILFDDQPGAGIFVELKPTAEMAWQARVVMSPIRSTYPDAFLAVVSPLGRDYYGCFGALYPEISETWKQMRGHWPDLPTRIPGPCRCGGPWIDPEYGLCVACWRDKCFSCGGPPPTGWQWQGPVLCDDCSSAVG